MKTSTWDWLLATDNGLLKLPHTDGLLQLSPCTLIFQKAMIIWNLQRQSLLIAKHREINQTKTDTLRFFFSHDDNLIGLLKSTDQAAMFAGASKTIYCTLHPTKYDIFWPVTVTDTWMLLTNLGKISAQPHPTLCIQFLNRENNDKNNTFPLGKQICFTIVWGCAETLLKFKPVVVI